MTGIDEIDATLCCIAKNQVELEETLNVTNLTLGLLVRSNERIACALEVLAGVEQPEE